MTVRLDRLIAHREATREARRSDRLRRLAETEEATARIRALEADLSRFRESGTSLKRWIGFDRSLDGITLRGAMEAGEADYRMRIAGFQETIRETHAAFFAAMDACAALDEEIAALDRSIEKLGLHRDTLRKAARKRASIREDAAVADLGRSRR